MNLKERYKAKKNEIETHLKTFQNKTQDEILDEHIFCLLTPQSNAKTCWQAVELIKSKNATTAEQISEILRGKARFHHTKAKRVVSARARWPETQKILSENIPPIEMRNKIAENVNGYGLKEAGHFLRNIGLSQNQVAILDRHIIRNLHKEGAIINPEGKVSNRKEYLKMEKQALVFSATIGIPIDHLDLLFWHAEHGEFFK